MWKASKDYCLILVDGTWGDWVEDACTATCGDAQFTKTRECSEPMFGGQECDRLDTSKTTPEDRAEMLELPCEDNQPCVGKYFVILVTLTIPQ